ncbi:hypothetical protein RJ639_022395 [Escallonia herrerae]|uniref:Uncharacterized protein n=1 Tax=Escallonia herrerae TaxID=1293975 RepID=A0AA89AGH9_9ASTE|nr:hypothetical protein RJ639_022395 [Escallonia herrerae]
MGKRRRDHLSKTPPPDFMPYSARVDSSSKEKPYNSVGTSSLKPLPSIMNIMDSSAKLPKYHLEPSYHYHNFSRTILPRHSRNYFGRQYSRRNSAYHGDTSTSHGKSTPSREEKLSSKFAGQCSAESRHHTGTETREKASRRPERIRSSPSPVNTVSADVVKMTPPPQRSSTTTCTLYKFQNRSYRSGFYANGFETYDELADQIVRVFGGAGYE